MNSDTHDRTSTLVSTLLLFAILFLAAWLPRVAKLDSFVTPDERRWLQRSANFLYALEQREYTATYQAGHPGVTVMWAGTAGILATVPTYAKQVTRPLNEDDFDAWIRANTSISLLNILVAGRRWIVLAISLLLALTYLPLSNLLGTMPASVAMLFVAWEPFHIGLSRQLHPDGLVATLLLFAIASFLAWLYNRQQRQVYLIFAGIATGLAILTKSPALVAPFVMVLLACAEWVRACGNPKRRATLWQGVIQLGVYSAFTYVLLWPAAWSSPIDVSKRMVNLAVEYSEQGHELPLFFWGQITNDPGQLFYPVSLLMRATPATLFGLVCVLVGLWRGWFPMRSPKVKQTLIALLLFAVVYMGAITFSAKKIDRYLLPAMPVLTVVASVGWVGIATRIGSTFSGRNFMLLTKFATLGLAVVLLHGLLSALNFPYYLTYFNPLFGGSRTAPQVIMVGWGEGLDRAARWINAQSKMTERRVVSWYGAGPLSYFLDPTIEVLPFFSGGEETVEYWFNADYAVLYVNQWQRENPSRDLIDYFLAQPPVYTVSFSGLDLVYVYALRELEPPDNTYLHRTSAAVWGEKIELAGYYLQDTMVFPGEEVPVALFWRGIGPIDQDYALQLSLLDAAGNALWSTTRSPAGIETSDWPLGKLWRDAYTLELPPDLPAGSYELVALFHARSGELLPLVTSRGGQGEQVKGWVVATLNVPRPTVIDEFSAEWQGAKINSVARVDSAKAGSSIFVDVATSVATAAPLKLSLRLVDDAGGIISQNDKVLEPTMRFRLLIPEETSPGTYRLSAVLYDPNSLAALPDQQGASSVNLSQIEIK